MRTDVTGGAKASTDLVAAVGREAPDGWSRMGDDDYDLAGAAHDQPAPPPGTPMRAYVLCTTPRSGSSLLAEGLHFLGEVGTPIEYFDPTNAMRVMWRRWGCSTLEGYVELLHARRQSSTGRFGLKLHWFQLEALSRSSPTGDATGADAAVSVPDAAHALRRVAPDATMVRVRRRDVERQAASWARAERTGRWSSRQRSHPTLDPPLGEDEVAHFVARIVLEERRWSEVLHHLTVEPFVVEYEDLCDDYAATVAAVARHVGRVVDPADVTAPRLVRQPPDQRRNPVARWPAD